MAQPRLAPPPRAAAGRLALMVAAFGVTGSFSHLLRSSHSVIAPEITRDLGIGPEGLGVMTSAFFLAYALSQVPTGVLLDRFGPRRIVPALFVVAILGVILFGTAGSLAEAALARALMGIGCAAIFMGAFVVCARWAPPERFGSVASVVSSLGNLGNLLAATPMALAAAYLGWRGAFFAIAVLMVGFGTLVLVVVRDSPPGARPQAAPGESLSAVIAGLGALLVDRRMHRLLVISSVCYATFATVFSLWVGPYLNDVHGLSGVERGNVILAAALTAVGGLLLWGNADRLFNTRKGLVIAGALGSAVVLLVLAAWPRPGVTAASLLLVLFALVGSYSLRVLVHCRALYPEHLAGRAMTTVNLAMSLGVAVVQAASGVIVGALQGEAAVAPETAYRVVFAFLAALTVGAILVYAPIEDAKPRPGRGWWLGGRGRAARQADPAGKQGRG